MPCSMWTRSCATAATAAALLCAVLLLAAKLLADVSSPQWIAAFRPLPADSQRIRPKVVQPAWPIQRELLQAVRRMATPSGAVFLAVRGCLPLLTLALSYPAETLVPCAGLLMHCGFGGCCKALACSRPEAANSPSLFNGHY